MKNKVINIISIILSVVCIGVLSLFSYYIFMIDIIPNKYLLIFYLLLFLVLIVLMFILFSKVNKIIKILCLIIMTLITGGFIVATLYLNNTYDFFNSTQTKEYDGVSYSVVVLNKSNYNEIDDLKNKKIGYLEDDTSDEVNKHLDSKFSYNKKAYTEFGLLPDDLFSTVIDAIVVEDSYYLMLKEEVENFEENTKVIYTFQLSVKTHHENKTEINITDESFILYISGIDQYGNVDSVRGRSDVNILAVVNPKTKKILLVNTPRDYYVQLAGTTGYKDKLTHAGIYGIEKSIATLENLYGIDINSYLRVNFNTLISVIDVIDGVDIYSDTTFRAWTNKNVYISEGVNHLNGEQALAYARERHAYLTGDHHRGANQQQVITAIINKVSKSRVLISKYNTILNSLNGAFQTDMNMNTITSLIKYQLDKMPSWDVESIAATGSNSSNYTYSMGTNYLLYVMEPDYNSIETAKIRMLEVLGQ